MPSSRTVALLALATLVPGLARADWPMLRQDPLRRSTGTSTSRIDRPAPAWRHYLGGSLGREQYWAFDVDGDGDRDVLFLMGGALLAKSANDAVIWETPALDLTRIDGLHDLDGDGRPELVASARAGRLHVVRPTDGRVLWSLPAGIVGNVGNVRFADFDGDSVLDLYVAEAACGSTGSLGDVAEAYSFAGSIAEPRRLFALERGRREYVCGGNDTIVDIDGDGTLEVIAQGVSYFYVYSGVDGSLQATSESVGSIPYGQATTVLADVDGDGRMELVCFTENSYAPPINSRRVFVMGWDDARATLVRRWERAVTDPLNDRHGFATAGVHDLLGDGSVEVVTSFYTAATGAWATVVLAGLDGTELGRVPVGPFQGLADLDGDGSPEIVVGGGEAGLSAFRYTATGLEHMFTAPRTDALFVRDEPRHRAGSARSRLLALDLNRDGAAELVALSTSGGRATALVALSAGMDPPRELARMAIDANVALQTFEVFSDVTRPYPQLLVARTDGYLWVLDERLQPTNAGMGGEFVTRGLRIGGYYSGSNGLGFVPVAADLDGDGAAEVLARDSRGVLQRLAPAGANLVEPPRVVWELPGALHPSIVDRAGDGTREIVVGMRGGGDRVRLIRAADASTVWERVVGTSSRTLTYDLVAGDLSGDGTLDVVYQLSESSGGTVVIQALDGRDGSPLWGTEFETVVAGSGLGANALADRDGDGRVDVLATPRNLFQWLSGADGASLGSVDAGYPGHGVFHDVNGDGALDVLASGAVYGVRAHALDLGSIWTAGTGLHTRVLGAVAECASGARYVQAHHDSARLTMWSVADGTVVGDIALRGGRRYAPPDTVPSGPGILGNVTVSPDLTGAGRPTVLVPSTDGHLYAVDPCSGALEWALHFRFPVGEAILADTDGDGDDEIIVTVADGFVYGIDREVLAAPLFVAENDGTRRATGPGDDIDELVTRDTLWANWASVEGATSYQYAVITPGGAFLTEPSFVDVGDVTEVAASGLPLVVGQRYLFAVRAIGPEGASSETLSDGVTVLPDPCDACGEGQICVEGECRPDPCLGVSCGSGERCVDGACQPVGPRDDAGTADGGPRPDGGVGTTAGGCCTIAPGAPGTAPGACLVVAALLLGVAVRRRRR